MGEKAVFNVFIEAPAERVWQELTKRDVPSPVFFGCALRVRGDNGDNGVLGPGAGIRMRTKDGKYTAVVGDVTEFDPPRRFAHTFKFTAEDDPPCTVVYDLEPAEGGTNFTLTILDLPAGTKTAKHMMQGGPFITATIKGMAERGKAPLGKRLMLGMMSLCAFMTPKKCLSENWK